MKDSIYERPELDPVNIIREGINKIIDENITVKTENIKLKKRLDSIKTYCNNGGLFSQWRTDIKRLLYD